MPIQQQITKIKGVADVVFCIDFSGSMASCIEGVKKHITEFVHSVQTSSPNLAIDVRIGFCAYTDIEFGIKDFTTSPDEFSKSLSSTKIAGGDEFTPGAMDYSISHFDWRKGANRFLIVFTDEQMTTGFCNNEIRSRFPLLVQKIADSKLYLFFFGEKCEYYSLFEQLSRAKVTFLGSGDFSSVDFSALLTSLGKTVSQSCSQSGSATTEKLPLVFDISRVAISGH